MSMMMQFPNLRETFKPDPGYMIFDADLSGADARVVAWEANDEDLMSAFEAGINVHIKNAQDIFPDLTQREMEKHGGNLKESYLYDRIKRGVHATNYGAKAATLAAKCSWTLRQSEEFQATWLYKLHEPILDWHERTEEELQTLGRTTNKFGDVIDWNDRYSPELWRQALAWTPQSTVAAVAARAQILVDEKVPECQFLLQLHDSLVFQIQKRHVSRTLKQVKNIFDDIVVPYPHPLIIPWDIKYSELSWGDCKKGDWSDFM